MGDLPKAIVIGATIIGAALVWSGYSSSRARFDVRPAAVGELVYRIDTHTGEMWACTQTECSPVSINTKTVEQSAADTSNPASEDLNELANQAAMDASNIEAANLAAAVSRNSK